MEKIGIFGGTFNPIHLQHVEMVKQAVKELNLDKIIVIPTYISPHKQGETAVDGLHRLNMLKLAFSGIDGVEISAYELEKGGVSYTYETILYFKSVYPNATLYYLMGSDMLENFPTWKNPKIICDNANLVLTSRLGTGFNDNKLIKTINTLYGVNVIKVSYVGSDVSSTMVRTFFKLGLSLDNLVVEKVGNYITKNNLYPPSDEYNYVKNALTEKRRKHTAMVIITALKLCKMVGVDKKTAELSALLHDVAKYKTPEDFIGFTVDNDVPPSVMHQFLGAYIVENVLKIKDIEVINAVKYHTTGRPNMSATEKLIFIADLIEPTRTFPGVEKLRQAVFNDFESGFKLSVQELYKYLTSTGETTYYLTKDCAEYYKGELL